MISESKAKSLAAFCSGFAAIMIQAILLRRLVILFDGSELVLAICLACWLSGLALGARAAGVLVEKKPELIAEAETLMLGGGAIYAVLAFSLIERGRGLLHLNPGEPAGLTALISAGILALCIGGAFYGALFPLLSAGKTHRAARIYSVEAVGGFFGGLVYTFLLAGRFDDGFSLSLCGPLLAIALIALALTGGRRPGVVAALLAIYLCSLPLRFEHDPAQLSETEKSRFSSLAPGLQLVGKTQTPYAEYLIGQGAGEKTLFISGRAAGSFPAEFEVTENMALIAAATAKLDRVLMVGGVAQGQLAALLKFPVRSVEYLEHDPQLLGFLAGFLTEQDVRALRDPRVRLVEGDARRYIADRRNGGWDLVLLNVPEPSGLGLNRYFTEQFYRLLSEKENAPVVITSLPSTPNYIGGEVGQVSASIYAAIRSNFNEVKAIPGSRMVIFAGPENTAFDLSPASLIQRYIARGKPLTLFDERSFTLLADERRIVEATEALAASRATVNDDYRPIAAYRTLLVLLRASGGSDPMTLGGNRTGLNLLAWWARLPGWIYLIIPLLFVAIRFKSQALSARIIEKSLILTAANSGFFGFVWQFVLMYGYQIRFGSLYGKLGLLIALYFAGLAVGAGLGRRVDKASCRQVALRWQPIIVALAGCPLLLLRLPLSTTGEFSFYLVTIVGAAVIGFEFALLLGAENFEKGSERAGVIYAADNVGGMLGSLLVGMFLLPLTGIYYTLALIASIKIAGALYLKK